MSITAHTPAATRPSIDRMRRTSLTAGILYLVTFVSVPTLALYQPVREQADFILGAGSDTGVQWAAFSEVVVALAGIGTAVVLFPVAKRQSETAALGFVAARVLEAGLIIVGVVSVLSVVTLRHDLAGTAGADPASLVTTGHTLAATYDCGLVPRILPTMGLIGAPLLLASDIAIFFGVYDRMAPIAALAALPIAAWEFSLGIYLTVKGFRPSAVAALPSAQAVR
jgi:hypothetical protein